MHALDNVAFIPSVTIRLRNDIFAEDDLWRRRDLNLGWITQVPQTASCTANRHCSSISLTFRKPQYMDKYPKDYNFHKKCVKFDACTNVQ